MRGMILAAGRGERMGSLTSHTPKPLLRAGDKLLIEYAIESFVKAEIREIVINVAYLAEKIQKTIGNGSRYGANIEYSVENERLETGGGIYHALPLLGEQPFVVMSSDVVTSYPLSRLPKQPLGLAHIVLVKNPPFHPEGDFGLRKPYIDFNSTPKRNFAGIGVYRPEMFMDCDPGFFPLNHILFPAIRSLQVTGEYYDGKWYNIGTPEQLDELAGVVA